MPITIKNRFTGEPIATIEDADDLREAVIRLVKQGVDLYGANLYGANLDGANLTPIRDDVWAVLSSSPAEVEGLLLALKEGRINGSTYHGDCACLVGTLANVRHCHHGAIPGLMPNADRAAERFFLMIREGHTPETSEPCKLAAGWVEEWLTRMRSAFAVGQSSKSM